MSRPLTLSRRARPAYWLALAAVCVALDACGATTRTVSVSNAPAPLTARTTTSTAGSGATTTTSSQPATGAPGTTRSAPEPAFVEQEHGPAGLAAASAVLRARGFSPADPGDYHPSQALEVLVGVRAGSGDGYGQQAFFFVNGRFIGTDTSQPSAGLRVVGQSDTEVTLAYPLYRSSDPLCCPSGGQARVRFELNNGKLAPLDPIPPLHSSTGFSRY